MVSIFTPVYRFHGWCCCIKSKDSLMLNIWRTFYSHLNSCGWTAYIQKSCQSTSQQLSLREAVNGFVAAVAWSCRYISHSNSLTFREAADGLLATLALWQLLPTKKLPIDFWINSLTACLPRICRWIYSNNILTAYRCNTTAYLPRSCRWTSHSLDWRDS